MRLTILFTLLLGLLTGCTDFDAPPKASLVGIEDGLLPDPLTPLLLTFDEPVDFKTLEIKVVRFITDPEGNLLSDQELLERDALLYRLDGATFEENGGSITDIGDADNQNQFFSILLQSTLPVGPQLALVIEPGLTDVDGEQIWEVPQVLKFGFEFSCGDESEAQEVDFPEQIVFFLLADVELPIQTQLQLLVDIRTDPTTGDWAGQFTNADREPDIDCSQFGLTCSAEEVCRTLPSPACVAPSERAATVSEYPDFFPNEVPPIGYSFGGVGCARPSGEAVAIANAPTDVEVQSPQITVKGIAFNLEVVRDADTGRFVGGGTFTGQEVFLGAILSGAGSGTATMIEIPPDELKPGIPPPPVGPN